MGGEQQSFEPVSEYGAGVLSRVLVVKVGHRRVLGNLPDAHHEDDPHCIDVTFGGELVELRRG